MAEAPPTGTPNPTAEKQLGSMVLDSNSGAIIQSSGDLSGDTKTAMLFYHMLQDTNAVLARMNKDPFRRLTISFQQYYYVVTIVGDKIYVMKKSV
jgi:hypothetical protein